MPRVFELTQRTVESRDPFAERQAAAAALRAADTAAKAPAAEGTFTFAKPVDAWTAAREGDPDHHTYSRQSRA